MPHGFPRNFNRPRFYDWALVLRRLRRPLISRFGQLFVDFSYAVLRSAAANRRHQKNPGNLLSISFNAELLVWLGFAEFELEGL